MHLLSRIIIKHGGNTEFEVFKLKKCVFKNQLEEYIIIIIIVIIIIIIIRVCV